MDQLSSLASVLSTTLRMCIWGMQRTFSAPDIDIRLQPHDPCGESSIPITFQDGWTHRDSVDVEEKMRSQFVSGVEHGRPANTKRLQASTGYLADVRRNRMQVKRRGNDVILLRHLLVHIQGHAVAELVKAMRYKPGFDTRWGHWVALWP